MNLHHRSKILILILIVTLFHSLYGCTPSNTFYITEDASFAQTKLQNGNQYQYNSNTLLTVADGKLYVCNFYRNLGIIEGGKYKSVQENGTGLCFMNDYFYYMYNTEIDRGSLYRYQISTGKETCIADSLYYGGGDILQVGKKMYIQTPRGNEYYIVEDDECGGPTKIHEEYQLGQNMCYFDGAQLTYRDANVMVVKVIDMASDSLLVSYQEGLLILPSSPGKLLYYVTSEGEWVEFDLDTTECKYVETSMNYYGDTVYISFVRKGQEGFKGPTTYDNDTISGTYKINTKDFSVTQMNNHYYDSIYVFDDTGLFVTTPYGSIHKLDFDGNKIKTIFQ